MSGKPFRVLDVCQITRTTNAKILRPYIQDESDPNFRKFKSLCSGIDIEAKSVYAALFGSVIEIGQYPEDPKHWCVTIQYDEYTIVRYGHLSSVLCEKGQDITFGDTVGFADVYVHVELCRSFNYNSRWSVYYLNKTWYKVDPMSFVDGTDRFPAGNELPIQYTVGPDDVIGKFDFDKHGSPEMLAEFSDGLGEVGYGTDW